MTQTITSINQHVHKSEQIDFTKKRYSQNKISNIDRVK